MKFIAAGQGTIISGSPTAAESLAMVFRVRFGKPVVLKLFKLISMRFSCLPGVSISAYIFDSSVSENKNLV